MKSFSSLIGRYVSWLHTRWPAGTVEKLPEVHEAGRTSLDGVRVVGDLTGIPLLKFSADSGAKAVQALMLEKDFLLRKGEGEGADEKVYDLAIIGGGVSGMAAAMEAKKNGLRFILIEADQSFATIANFPKAKPIYAYPMEMVPEGDLSFNAQVKEALVEELKEQQHKAGIDIVRQRIDHLELKGGEILLHQAKGTGDVIRALRVIVAIGRTGNFRKLGCPGEGLPKVFNRLHDPSEFSGKNVLVVGGGDSALEAVIALAGVGAHVTLSYRKESLSRPKPDNVALLARLEKDPSGPVAVESPTSGRVTTATQASDVSGQTGSVTVMLGTSVKEITEEQATIVADGKSVPISNDVVFSMIGREPPLDFFRRSGIKIRGEWTSKSYASLALVLLIFGFVYHWKNFKPLKTVFAENGWFPHGMPTWFMETFSAAMRPEHLLGTLALTLKEPSFYYSLLYTVCIMFFGIRRIRRRDTPYIRKQTMSLMAIQIVPLFLLPYIILPWMGHNGFFGDRVKIEMFPVEARAEINQILKSLPSKPSKVLKGDAVEVAEWKLHKKGAHDNALYQASLLLKQKGLLPKAIHYWEHPMLESVDEHDLVWVDAGLVSTNRWWRRAEVKLSNGRTHVVDWDLPHDFAGKKAGWIIDSLCPVKSYAWHGREYWRVSGLVLAWPLFIWNVFTGEPMWLWLIISLIQTFIIIPLLIWRYGKGAYCGWICSCGALAETMGDAHRHKMPHGPVWNRLNMLGQVFLGMAFLLLALRVGSWIWEDGWLAYFFHKLLNGIPLLNYAYVVDLWWAGILGLGLYFHFSGRVWCRFACPLAALMHIYSRFSRFRIFADKKKCISCNVCTSVCHQGIDIMSFANKGLGMQDPECVRCSACVTECPTGVLNFGHVDADGKAVFDTLEASPVQMREQEGKGNV